MIPVFILTYSGYKLLHRNTLYFPNTKFYVVDNGRQVSDKPTGEIIHVTQENIGCAGGWNLICKIGFDHCGFDKIVITQDDAEFTEKMLRQVYEESTPDHIMGGYSTGFGFSLFGLHRQFYEDVGPFDENFLEVTHEDNDYMVRAEAIGKTIGNAQFKKSMNKSYTSRRLMESVRQANAEYLKWKIENEVTTIEMTDRFKEAYGDRKEWPSEIEYKLFKDNERLVTV